MPDFDKLHNHIKKLNKLLSERYPGFLTWSIMVAEDWKTIAEMWDDAINTDNIKFINALNIAAEDAYQDEVIMEYIVSQTINEDKSYFEKQKWIDDKINEWLERAMEQECK